MICPFCGKEMESGKLIVNDPRSAMAELLWQNDNKKYDFVDKALSMDGIPVYGLDTSCFGRLKISGYHCPACEKFIFDGRAAD